MSDELKLLDPRKLRAASEVEVDLGDGQMVLARKQDMTALVFEGHVPMPMLAAVQKMVEMPNASPMERVEALGGEGKNLVELLRKHAVNVVMRPRVVEFDAGDPTTVPVEYLSIQQLMAIWNATAVVPKFGPSQAARFRRGARAHAPAPVPTEPAVPPPPKRVAGADVEYVGQ